MANIDLAARLADEHGITKADARKFIDTLLAVVVEAAVQGEDVSFPGFGKFKWDGDALVWNVYRSTWDYLVSTYPRAAEQLELADATRSI